MRMKVHFQALVLVGLISFAFPGVSAGEKAKKAPERAKAAPRKADAPKKAEPRKAAKPAARRKSAPAQPAKKVAYAIKVTPAKKLVVNKPATVTVTADKQASSGVKISVVYYPYSEASVTVMEKLRTDTGGTLQWTPKSPGLVIVKAVKADGKDKKGKTKYKTLAKTTVSVQYDGLPMGGLLVFALAGFLLFGGMTFGFFKAFSQE
ncbi:MAG: hypothetical protein EP343_20605 [Deltaproteobacteria bacterium]|nr:MAG: hypothetical protein EP343_20605 [Deltaproteobacteria bacterium]